MLTVTHAALAIASTSLLTGTADPWVLGAAAIASQLPDVDTSGSVTGRVFHPISRWLEARYPHRSMTHSFSVTGLIAVLLLPLMFWGASQFYWALLIGYWMGWFGDVFTKSGVAAFFPHQARLVIPANPRLRLSSGSKSESGVLAVLVLIGVVSININSSGGIMRSFDQMLGSQSGAIEIYQRESARHQVFATIEGRHTITQQAVAGQFEIIGTIAGDLLVKDSQNRLYRAGGSPEAQIAPETVHAAIGAAINLVTNELFLDSQPVGQMIRSLHLPQNSYLSGQLLIDALDRESVQLHGSKQYFQPIQSFNGVTVELESASPAQTLAVLGDIYATGSLVVRSIYVQS
ncbi:metal-dependent hydrolase [Rivularia sp. UHCC 0363]|uniref:metal-dependent hydrolase n=1 Tax=Rivularia sp. UHCC 0363 TaxID=3110244 RepID=UPI002B21CCB4|nr:metal-dependent hydrolase [Rivularia sp. UHCC 0363]MEA5597370.1 metal-dependent hydrolase [Rivularia sp. UHCC 0363]